MNRRLKCDDQDHQKPRILGGRSSGTRRAGSASISLLLVLMTSTFQLDSVQAQALLVGFEIGGSVVSLNYNAELSSTLDNRARPSYSVKAFADLPISSALGLQVGARYVGLGTRVEIYGGYQLRAHLGTERVYHTYLAFPIRARVQHGPWFGTVGPEFGYLLAAHASVRVPVESLPSPDEPSHWVQPLKEYSEPWNTALCVAFGRQLHWGRFRYHVQLGYSYGLRTIGHTSSNDARTEEFLLSLGITFRGYY